MKDQRINIGKLEIQVKEYKHAGEAVVFLHFGGGNLMMWLGVTPYFQKDYHVALLDLRGHGKSDKPKTGYHMDDMAQDVVRVMDGLQIDRAHIVGSSLGAEVGLSMAANYPDRVVSLVCEGALFNESGPYGLWQSSEEEFKAHAAETLENLRTRPANVFASIDALVEDSRQNFEARGWWNEIFASVKRYDAIEIEEGKYTDCWGRIAEEYMKNYLFYNFGEYYKKVKCPLLMMPDEIPGQDEREKQIMADLFALTAHGKITAVPGWMHPFGWMLTPEAGSRAVLDFLAGLGR